MAQVTSGHHEHVPDGAPKGGGVRQGWSAPRARLQRAAFPGAGRAGRNRGGKGAVFARRLSRQLQEDVVERGASQCKVAGHDAFVTQRRRGSRHQLNSVAAGGHRELVRPLGGLRIAATHCRKRCPCTPPIRGLGELHLQDLAPDAVLELVAGSLRDHSPVVDDRDTVGELVGLLQVLGGQQYRRPVSYEVADRPPDLVATAGVEPRRRLIEEEHARATDEARREVEAPAHPSRVSPCGAICRIGKVEAIKQTPGPLVRLPP